MLLRFRFFGFVISIHALLAESDRRKSPRRGVLPGISIHALLAESDNGHEQAPYRVVISIHALLAESDVWELRHLQLLKPFLSTLSLRRATHIHAEIGAHTQISIHALLAESDQPAPGGLFADGISIHALLAESDPDSDFYKNYFMKFLSTLSLRRATRCVFKNNKITDYFYPRSPCGERPP